MNEKEPDSSFLPRPSAFQRRFIVRWLLWWSCVAVWTVGLLSRDPMKVSQDILPQEYHFTVSKAVHVSAYAFLAATTAWLPVPVRWRWGLVAFLVLHGCGTEFGQLYVETRTGSLRDVGLDCLGIVIGLAASWKWFWRE
jgi:hypothetical protein